MGKSSSSSSSSSDSSDDEQKRWKKQQKRMRKIQKHGPGYYENRQHKHKKKDKHGKHGKPGKHGHMMPGQHGAPYGAGYPAPGVQPGYPAAGGGYPPPAGAYPPPAGAYPPPAGAYPPPAGAYPPTGGPPGGYPGGQPGYPPQGGAPGGYPPGQPYNPAGGSGDIGFGGPGGGGIGFDSGHSYPGQVPPQPSYPAAPTYGGPPTQGFPQNPAAGMPQSGPPPAVLPQAGYGYGQPGAGAPPGVGAPPGGYGQPGAGAPGGYSQPSAGYGQPGAGAPPGGYGQPGAGAPPSGYGQPASGAAPAGYGQPSTGAPPSGYGQPGAGVPGAGTPNLAQDFSKMTMAGSQQQYQGTIRQGQNFNAENDAAVLRKAMKGAGTDEAAIIDLVRNRSNAQRQEIKKMFKTMYGKDLIKDLSSELSGNFEELILALFMPTTYYDAWSLKKAMDGLGTKESILIEILCTRSNSEIREIIRCYKEHFRRELEKDVVSDTSGFFKRLLVSCCQANRDESSTTNFELAKSDAQKLYQAGEKKWGTDESMFITILALRNAQQLNLTFNEYIKISQRDILNSIDRELSGDVRDGMKTIVMSARNRPEYFADRLYRSMKGAGTSDSTLIRVVVSRSEIDLTQIKAVFLQKYQKTLAKFIEQDTSGDYKRMLVGVVGYN